MPCSPAGNTVNACCLGPVLYTHSSKSLETKLEQTCPSPRLFYATVFLNLHKYVCPTLYLSKDRYTTSLTTLLPVWLEPSFLKRSTAPSHGIPAVTMPHTCEPWLGIAQEKEDEYVTYLALQDWDASTWTKRRGLSPKEDLQAKVEFLSHGFWLICGYPSKVQLWYWGWKCVV